jgi:hypothetical protein
MSLFKKTVAVLAIAGAVSAPAVMSAQARQASDDAGGLFGLSTVDLVVAGVALAATIALFADDDSDSG